MGSLKEMTARAEAAMEKSPDVPKPPEYKGLKDMYIDWVTPHVESIKKTLSDMFPEDRYEFTVTKRPSFLKWLEDNDKGTTKKNEEFFGRCTRGVESSVYNMRGEVAYTIVLHYPSLTVKNSRGGKLNMTDMYIKIQLSPLLNDTYQSQLFTGLRTSYTLAEFTSGYNFSHLSSQASTTSFSHFCLGGTPFSTLCRTLAIEFNPHMFGLFLAQLESYLSWESLEGGPYKRMENIHERGHYHSVSISGPDKVKYYKDYLASGHVPNVELNVNPYYHTLVVVEDDDFRSAVTKVVTNDNHLQFWDSERKVASDRSITNRRQTIDQYVRQHCTNSMFKFKGKDIKMVFTDIQQKDEKDDKVKVAHQQILRYIVDSINKSLLNNIKNDFTKKKRAYTTR